MSVVVVSILSVIAKTLQFDPLRRERDVLFARWERIAGAIRALQIEGGDVLRRIVDGGHLAAAGASSVGHFGELRGSSAQAARAMLDLHAAIAADPRVREEVVSGAIPVERAAIVGQASRFAWLRALGDDWFALAHTMSTRDMRQLLAKRFDEHRQRDVTEPVTLFVTADGRHNLERARELVSRARHENVALGHAVSIVIEAWLRKHDPLRRGNGSRRVPDTERHPHGRYIPAAVDRAVRARSGDRCIVPFCPNRIWVERSHRIAHARGGCNEAFELDELCDVHHLMYERKLLRIEGTPDAPRFFTASGELLGPGAAGSTTPRGGGRARPTLGDGASERTGPIVAAEDGEP